MSPKSMLHEVAEPSEMTVEGLTVITPFGVPGQAPPWMLEARCTGHSAFFFAPSRERPDAREHREQRARAFCASCPVLMACRTWAREHREYGVWGGETEEERAEAGFRVALPVGRLARYPRGEGSPVSAKPVAVSISHR